MLKNLIENKHILITYFTVLIIDIVIKTFNETSFFRLFTKSLLLLILMFYCFSNRGHQKKNNFLYVMLALSFFLVGDLFMLFFKIPTLFSVALFCFILGKTFYVLRLATNKDFNITTILPYVIFIFFYMLLILLLVYNNLNEVKFYLVLMYLLAALKVFLFSLLRKNDVKRMSYLLVIYGVCFSVLSDSVSAILAFSNLSIPFGEILIMLFYGLSQFFIVLGMVKETSFDEEELKQLTNT